VEHLSPEEVEEGKFNDLCESVAQLQRKGTCTTEIIERYQSEVIPPAEKSKFNVPKNKFLFLANRDIGNCYLALQKFAEAESSFQKILQYAPLWPGTNDSAYPINFRQIATAQMGQQHWTEAEQSLLKSVDLFDPQLPPGKNRTPSYIRNSASTIVVRNHKAMRCSLLFTSVKAASKTHSRPSKRPTTKSLNTSSLLNSTIRS